MVDEKVIDFGTFVIGALAGALIYFTPQIQQLAGDDPVVSLAVGIIMMVISQIGSRYAINQVKVGQEQPELLQ